MSRATWLFYEDKKIFEKFTNKRAVMLASGVASSSEMSADFELETATGEQSSPDIDVDSLELRSNLANCDNIRFLWPGRDIPIRSRSLDVSSAHLWTVSYPLSVSTSRYWGNRILSSQSRKDGMVNEDMTAAAGPHNWALSISSFYLQ